MGVERERVQSFGSLAEGLRQAGSWYLWGPYLSERQWGTVREDYSADGEAWSHLPHDHARSRAYRWGEDGLAGFSDVEQRLCLALALWNGRDPILKERIFGLTGGEGNHGEDAKEYWWYLDAVPSHAWNRWRYHYPQRAVPLRAPADGERPPRQAGPGVRAAGHRGVRRRPLLGGRGALREGRTGRPADDRGGHQRGSGGRRAARAADRVVPQHVVVGGGRRAGRHGGDRPDDASRIPHPFLGELELVAGPGPDGTQPELLFCDNETNTGRLYGQPGAALPQGRHQRPRRGGRADREPRPAGQQMRRLVPPAGRAGRDGRAAAAAAACGRRPPVDLGPEFDAGARPQAGRGRRVLRRAHPRGGVRGRGAGDAPGVRRDAVEQAAVLLRRARAGWTAIPASRRRPPRGAAGATPGGARSTPSTSCRCPTSGSTPGSPPGTWRSTAWRWRTSTRVREVPADPAVSRVVPAPEWRAARLRVGLRRRQPARAGVGGAGGVRHRRRPRHRLPVAGCSTSCC